MKSIYLFLMAAVAVTILLTSACDKKGTDIIEPPIVPIDSSDYLKLGTVKVKKNGVDWIGGFTSHLSHTVPIFVFTGEKNTGAYLETFGFMDIPRRTGKYTLEFWPDSYSLLPNQIPSAVFLYTYDLDEPAGSFRLDTLRSDHFIEVTRFDSINNIVEGRFQVFLRFSPGSPHNPYPPDLPDTISMTEGRFHLNVED
jgi:hypothetical protein